MNIESCNHFFFDGYEIETSNLNNNEIISHLLNDINKEFLSSKGECVIIPCFDNKSLLDDGISGIILGNNFHFTCHTFSNRNVLFIDLYGNKKVDSNNLINIFKNYFGVKKYDLCVDNKITGKFGKHIIIKTDIIEYDESLKLIDKIIENIEMHPIYEKISYVDKNGYDILRPIAESHVSIHCHNNECVIDVFSCNTFDEKGIFNLLKNINSIKSVERGIFLTKS